MKAFIRENPTIAFGLGLPLLVVVAFLLISGIPTLLVAPPQYDVLFATDYYNYNGASGVHISVVDRKVRVVYQGGALGYQNPRLWRYSAKTGALKEIAIPLPPGLVPLAPGGVTPEVASRITPIDVPDVANLTVDSSSIAPDGYEFSAGTTDYGRDILTGLFFSSHYRDEAILKKDGRSVRLPRAANGYYYGNPARFVGWVVAP